MGFRLTALAIMLCCALACSDSQSQPARAAVSSTPQTGPKAVQPWRPYQVPFNSSAWQSNRFAHSNYQRWAMIDDLIPRLPSGSKRPEIERLLGKPDLVQPGYGLQEDSTIYWLFQMDEGLSDRIDSVGHQPIPRLILWFDGNKKLLRPEVKIAYAGDSAVPTDSRAPSTEDS